MENQARTAGASCVVEWTRDGALIEMSKNDWRRARAPRHGSTLAKGVANFSNYFPLFEAGGYLSQRRKEP
jgi:hypothetical protein